MTDILNNLTNDVGSDREDIQKLFPKCKPKSDVNLNKIRQDIKHLYSNRNSISADGAVVNASNNAIIKNRDFLGSAIGEGGGGGGGGGGGRCHRLKNASFLTNQYNENLLHSNEQLEAVSPTNSSSDSSTSGSICHVDNSENNYRDQIVNSSSSSSSSSSSPQQQQLPSDHMVVDNSVVSAYDQSFYNMEESNGNKSNGGTAVHYPSPAAQVVEDDELPYDESLDVGYRIPVMRKEFKLRESRIEIAGGREVFSSSRSRPSKKRFSDEIQYRPSADMSTSVGGGGGGSNHHHHNQREMKRHSAETLYGDHAGAYQLKSAMPTTRKSVGGENPASRTTCSQPSNGQWSSIKHNRSRTANHKFNKVVCNVDDSPSDPLYNNATTTRSSMEKTGKSADADAVDGVPAKQRETFILKGQRSGMFIYETVVRGSSEVVYDDIEDRTCCFKQQQQQQQQHQVDDVEEEDRCISSRIDGNSVDAGNCDEIMSERDDVGSPADGKNANSVITGSGVKLMDSIAPNQTIMDETMDTESGGGRCSPSGEKFSVTQLIGSLSIAQYEGSPRRYGPRPGHPQRMTMVSDSTAADGETSSNEVMNVDETIAQEVDLRFQDAVSHVTAGEEQLKNRRPPSSLSTNYDYLYEESETRKVLEEFYHQDGLFERLKAAAAAGGGTLSVEAFNELEYRLYRNHAGNSYVGRRLAHSNVLGEVEDSPKKRRSNADTRAQFLLREHLLAATLNSIAGSVDSDDMPCLSRENLYNFNLELVAGLQSTTDGGGVVDAMEEPMQEPQSQPDATSSTCIVPDTEDLAETEVGEQVGQSRNFTLSPETTECDSNDVESEVSMDNEGSLHSSSRQYASMPVLEDGLSSGHSSDAEEQEERDGGGDGGVDDDDVVDEEEEDDDEDDDGSDRGDKRHSSDHHVLTTLMMKKQISEIEREIARRAQKLATQGVGGKHDRPTHLQQQHFQQPHIQPSPVDYREVEDYLRRCDAAPHTILPPVVRDGQPVPQFTANDPFDHVLDSFKGTASSPLANQVQRPLNSSITCESVSEAINEIKQAIQRTKSITLKSPPMEKPETEDVPVWVLRPTFKQKSIADEEGRTKEDGHEEDECDTDQETDRLLGKQRSDDPEVFDDTRLSDLPSTQPPSSPITNVDTSANLPSQEKEAQKKKGRTKEVLIHEPAVLIEGVLFRARYLGSTQLVCEGQPTKATRMMQAEEAVSSIKAPEGETQPSTEVDLFISTEKIMVLNTDLKEIMMDHALRTISYIADIGDLVVLMARRRVMSTTDDIEPKLRRTPKMICHVFESEEAQFIAQSIGQAFQVAYMEFLKANGIEDHSFVKEMDYQEVLNSQEIYGDELEMFAKKEMQKEVIVPKLKGEILGVVIVESGWGSMLPTVVIANLSPNGAAARCGQLNIGDQIIAVNGISLVGLPLSTCQTYVKNAKNQTVVKLTVVPCAPVVEVKIKRPDTKYQLGFSVQNGVICSLLRGGIAERGGVRVGHRIIEINGQSVVAVPHERIVNLLATSVGEIHMKTMPTSMFRLLTGQESPVFI